MTMLEISTRAPNLNEPEFYILNEMDRPYGRHIVQKVGQNLFKYIHPDFVDWGIMGRDFGMTPLHKFGITWEIQNIEGQDYLMLRQTGGSSAKYRNGDPRRWQGDPIEAIPYNKEGMRVEEVL